MAKTSVFWYACMLRASMYLFIVGVFSVFFTLYSSDEAYAVLCAGHIPKLPGLPRSFPRLCIQRDFEVSKSKFL